MNWRHKICHWIQALFRKEKLDQDMDEELRAHLELRTQANIQAGMSPEEARYAAQRSFGGVEQVKEVCRDLRGTRWVESTWRDVRFGSRLLAKNWGFSTIAVLTLALGIGANTAIFTLINTLLLKSVPGVKNPAELVLVTDRGAVSLPCVLFEWARDRSQSLSGLCASAWTAKRRLVIPGAGAAGGEPAWSQAVSGNFFSVLGVPVVQGRALTPDDDRVADPQAVAVISYGFWQRRFGLNPAVVGQTVTMDGVPFTIVGVAAREFCGFTAESRPDLWWPLHTIPRLEGADWAENFTNPTAQWLRIIGRLKPGVSREQARAELEVNYQQLLSHEVANSAQSDKDRGGFRDHRIELQAGGAGSSGLRGEFQKPLYLLMTAASLVLLVACANLAGLLLARGAARHREFSLRAALGASRFTLVRQLGTESLLLAAIGGVVGLLLCQWAVRLLATYLPGYGESIALELAPDLRVLAFTFGISAITGVCCGLVPAWNGSRWDLATAIKDQTGSLLTQESGRRWNQALVVTQIALSCCLLIGAGLFVRTVQKLKALEVGFNRENLLGFTLSLGRRHDSARQVNLYRELLRRLEALPGVRSASFSSLRSMSGDEQGWGPGKVVREDQGDNAGLHVRGTGVGPGYFETLGIPLLSGRTLGWREIMAALAGGNKPATFPVVLDRTSARKLFGDQDPVGKRLRAVGLSDWPPLEVVGMVGDVIHKELRRGLRISIYGLGSPQDCPFFYVRSVGSPLAVAGGIRQVMRELDLEVELSQLQTMGDLVNGQLLRERTLSQLATFFSLLALAVACLGLYGILSYGVVRRTREIGVRMALGAQIRDVLMLVIRQGMLLTLAGCALGVLLALVLMRLISSLLYGVTTTDPLTFATTVGLLGAVAFLACWIPARRASRVNPTVALRYE